MGKSPIKIKSLQQLLKSYPNERAARFLESGFTEGFCLNYTGPRMPVDLPNLKSAENNKDITQEKIRKEIKLGRYIGPFESRPLKNLRTNPIGLVPKKSPGDYRLINHLSYPPGYSVNDFIADEHCKGEYTRFDTAVEMVAEAGMGVDLAKEDIKSAFRLLPMHPKDFEVLGVKFEGKYYLDKCLPMGVRCAPAYFETFSTFIEYCVRERSGSNGIIHYVDDFLCVSSIEHGGVSCLEMVQVLKGTISGREIRGAYQKIDISRVKQGHR